MVDRHLKQAVEQGLLRKVSGGVYHAPKQTAFGAAPAPEEALVTTFLKGGSFPLASTNAYNGLGVGATQLHNKTVGYNHKRHGKFKLGSRIYEFRVKPTFPRRLSPEFLLVDLVNNLGELGEEKQAVLERVERRAAESDGVRLKAAVRSYGSEKTKKFFARALAEPASVHVA